MQWKGQATKLKSVDQEDKEMVNRRERTMERMWTEEDIIKNKCKKLPSSPGHPLRAIMGTQTVSVATGSVRKCGLSANGHHGGRT